LANQGSLIGQNPSFCQAQEVLFLKQHRFGQSGKFCWAESIVLPDAGSFIPQTASFWPILEDLLVKQHRSGGTFCRCLSQALVFRAFAGFHPDLTAKPTTKTQTKQNHGWKFPGQCPCISSPGLNAS
jgi:hypothetical protein